MNGFPVSRAWHRNLETETPSPQPKENDMATPTQNQSSKGNIAETKRKPPVSDELDMSGGWKPLPAAYHEACAVSSDLGAVAPDDEQDEMMTMEEITSTVLAGSVTMATATITSSLPGATCADKTAMLLTLREQMSTITDGSMEPAEAMAFMQAKTLELVFHDLVSRAYTVRNSPRFDYLIRLAFRAQAQSARTLETLAVLKKPPVFAQQVNMANQQVVSNQAPVAKNPEAKSKARKRSAKPAKGSPKKTVRLAQKTKSPPPSDATK
jgi:hypothetical protein